MNKLLWGMFLAFSFISTNTYANSAEQSKIEYNKNTADVIDILAQKIHDYKVKNPNATDAELNLYVEGLLKAEVSSKPIYEERGIWDYAIGIGAYVTGRLNEQEKALFSTNKAKAVLCISHGKTAVNQSNSRYVDTSLVNGNGDAFRHGLWTALMASDKNIGADFAKKWSDAHEYGASEQNKMELDMDIYNNAIGIQIGTQNPSKTTAQLITIVQQSVRQGKMKIISQPASHPIFGTNTARDRDKMVPKLVQSSSSGEKKSLK